MYLRHLQSLAPSIGNVSATAIAAALGLGEVQVRKDLRTLCGSGKPKVGYKRRELIKSLEAYVECESGGAVIVGAGQLGKALLDYGGFESFGIPILAAFDKAAADAELSPKGKPILPMRSLARFCESNDVKLGIIAVPAEAAQEVCNALYGCGVRAMWCFAPCTLHKPPGTVVEYENLALSLAHLKMQLNHA